VAEPESVETKTRVGGALPLAAFPKCFLNDLVVTRSMSPADWIDMACTRLDIDGLEFYWGFTPGDTASRRELRRRAESFGKSIPMMCYSSDFTHADPAERARQLDVQKRAIEATSDLGGKYCRVLSGQRRPGLEVKEGVEIVAECIIKSIDFAREHGITLILENHYKDGFWQYPEFAQKIAVFTQLLDAIPESPNFGVNYDPSNTIIAGEDPLEMLEKVKHRVVTMHASDRFFEGGTWKDLQKLEASPQTGYASILKHGVIGRGLNDYDRIFSTLKGAGFDGWVSIEDGEDPSVGMEHLKLSAEFLRAKMAIHGLR
jgi:sugar phosphate isomerase/epimerase